MVLKDDEANRSSRVCRHSTWYSQYDSNLEENNIHFSTLPENVDAGTTQTSVAIDDEKKQNLNEHEVHNQRNNSVPESKGGIKIFNFEEPIGSLPTSFQDSRASLPCFQEPRESLSARFKQSKENIPPRFKQRRENLPPRFKQPSASLPPRFQHPRDNLPPRFRHPRDNLPPRFQHPRDNLPPRFQKPRDNLPPRLQKLRDSFPPRFQTSTEVLSGLFQEPREIPSPLSQEPREIPPPRFQDPGYIPPPGFQEATDSLSPCFREARECLPPHFREPSKILPCFREPRGESLSSDIREPIATASNLQGPRKSYTNRRDGKASCSEEPTRSPETLPCDKQAESGFFAFPQTGPALSSTRCQDHCLVHSGTSNKYLTENVTAGTDATCAHSDKSKVPQIFQPANVLRHKGNEAKVLGIDIPFQYHTEHPFSNVSLDFPVEESTVLLCHPVNILQHFNISGNQQENYLSPVMYPQTYQIMVGNPSLEQLQPHGYLNSESLPCDHLDPETQQHGFRHPEIRQQVLLNPESLLHGVFHPESRPHGFPNLKSRTHDLVLPEGVKQGFVHPESLKPGFVVPESTKHGFLNPVVVKQSFVDSEGLNHRFVNAEKLQHKFLAPGYSAWSQSD